jgi:hypothetical protein
MPRIDPEGGASNPAYALALAHYELARAQGLSPITCRIRAIAGLSKGYGVSRSLARELVHQAMMERRATSLLATSVTS